MPLIKLLLTVSLAGVLVSSGPAWALQHCPTDNEAAGHVHTFQTKWVATSRDNTYSSVASAIKHRHHPLSRIHCPENQILKLFIGPVSSAFRLEAPKEAYGKTISPAVLNVTTRTVDGSLLDWAVRLLTMLHLSPHLFFSKLRI
jgi:hypothetical protein